jgi:arginyl-tRNA synthetase
MMFDKERATVEGKIIAYLKRDNLPSPEMIKWTRIPFSGEWGISTSFFQAAADEARAGKDVIVSRRAQELANSVKEHLGHIEGFSHIEVVKGYLNLYFESGEYSRRVIDEAVERGKDFGRGKRKKQQVMVEFSQPNTHKAMHVGHLRTMMLGDVISNILEFAGYDVVRANYFGDSGRDVAKWLWNFRKRHAGETKPKKDITRWMGDLYAETNQMLEKNPEQEKEIQELHARWDAGDQEIVDLWKETRQWSLEGFNEIYDIMGIRFDHVYCESQVEPLSKPIVEDLIKRGIATDDRDTGGTVVVKLDELLGLDEETYRVLVLLRSDGTALYGAWDLALAQKKFEDYDLDKSIYVVDVRQSLHFKQVFKTLELAGWDKVDKVYHLPYEVVTLPGNVTMSSREGTVVLLEELIREAIQRAREVGQERNPDLDPNTHEEVAKAVGLGAIKYPLLARETTKVAQFDWQSALDFTGHSAPYIQYAYVRTNSLLKKLEGEIPVSLVPSHVMDEREIALIDRISRWPEVVLGAAEEYKTLDVTNHAYELAKAFNEFYNHCPVLKAEPEVRNARVRLVAAAREALRNALTVLGIDAPEVM